MTTGNATRPRRIGFTLVELLVVIVIITALAAIIIPAVYMAVGKAKQARIGLEVANISQALERYRQEYGEYPPDFSSAATLQWRSTARRAEAKRLIDDHLMATFRRRDMSNDIPNEVLDVLDPRTALVFWLQGFSPDPQYPIWGGGERSGFFEFDKGRFNHPLELPTKDGTTSRVFAAQYYPNGEPEKNPYIYYRGSSYTELLNDPSMPSTDPRQLPAVRWAHHINQESQGPDPLIALHQKKELVSPPYLSSTLSNNNKYIFVEPDKFQLISAGLDGDYGTVKVSSAVAWDTAITNYAYYPMVPNGMNCEKNHKDNLTSFSGGVIADLLNN